MQKISKVVILTLSIGTILGTGMLFYFNSPDKLADNHIVLEAKTDGYYTTEELEAASPIIVKGTKTKEGLSESVNNQFGEPLALYTMSSFRIDSIIKNDTNVDLNINDEIPILENEAEYNGKIYHNAGYNKMKENNKYILLLNYYEDVNYYIPTAVTFGKVPLDESEPIIYQDHMTMSSEEPIQVKLVNELRQKYQNE